MFKALLVVRLKSLWQSTYSRSSNKPRTPIQRTMIGIGFVLLFFVIMASFSAIFYEVGKALISIGFGWAYLSMSAVFAFLLCFVGGIFVSQSQLFDAKDNELLLSMPIPPSYILSTRVLMLLLLNYLYSLMILGPAIVVYFILVPFSVPALIIFIIAFLLLPLLALAVCCLLGWVIALISSRMRRKNLISTIFMLLFFALYMMVCFNMQEYITKLAENGVQIGNAIKQALPPFYFFGHSIASSNFLELLFLALWCIIPCAVVYFMLSKSFIGIATSKKGAVKVKYKERPMTQSSAKTALFKKELRHFFGMPMYVLNCGLGSLMLLLLSGYMIFQKDMLTMLTTEISAEFLPMVPAFITIAIVFCASLNCSTAPSISLEGSYFWTLKALPIRTKDVFFSKIAVNLLVGMPFVIIAVIVTCIIIPVNWQYKVLLAVISIAAQLMFALVGLTANLFFVRLNWVNPTIVLKQSMSVLIAVLGGMAYCIAPVLIYLAVSKWIAMNIYMLIWAFITVLICIILMAYLAKGGIKRYENIQ